MKVYLTAPSHLGRAIHRIASAIGDYAPPWVEVVPTLEEADLHVIQALWHVEREPVLAALAAGTQKPYAVVQHTLRTSDQWHTAHWLPFWQGAKLVWSHYDLPRLMAQDGAEGTFPFYQSPFGSDARIFSPQYNRDAPSYLVGTSGYVAQSEGIPEWAAVVKAVNRRGFHLGPRLAEHDDHWTTLTGITDQQVAQYWSQCRYVCGMRRVEGFELPAVEGLLCGARPVVYDQPHYRVYEEHAEYIPETEHEAGPVIESLLGLLEQPYRAVTASEIAWARARFAWGPIIQGFWARLEGTI